MNSNTDVLIPICNPDGELIVIEAPPSKLCWTELLGVWSDVGTKLPLCFAPPEEKLDVFFSYACQTAGLPISIATVFNPGWTEMFLKKIQHENLVISASLAPYLVENGLFRNNLKQLKAIILVGENKPDLLSNIQKIAPHSNVFKIPHPAAELVA